MTTVNAIDPSRKHTPCYMTMRPNRFGRQGGRNQRKWTVWYYGYNCPACGSRTSRPVNPFRGRKVPPPVCDGITYDEHGRPTKRPARILVPPSSEPGSAAPGAC